MYTPWWPHENLPFHAIPFPTSPRQHCECAVFPPRVQLCLPFFPVSVRSLHLPATPIRTYHTIQRNLSHVHVHVHVHIHEYNDDRVQPTAAQQQPPLAPYRRLRLRAMLRHRTLGCNLSLCTYTSHDDHFSISEIGLHLSLHPLELLARFFLPRFLSLHPPGVTSQHAFSGKHCT